MAKDNDQESGLSKGIEALIWSWGHNLRRECVTILDQIKLIRLDLEKPSLDLNSVNARLNLVELIAQEINESPLPFQIENVSLNLLIKERVNDLRQRTLSKGVNFQVKLDANKPIVVRANSVWLRRLFDILVDNAIDAMKESSKKRIKVVTYVDQGGVCVSVSDTGMGIDKRLIANLFQKPSTYGPSGSGRGLYVAHLLADIYGGKIEVKDTGPTGTTVVIWLPLEMRAEREKYAFLLVSDKEKSSWPLALEQALSPLGGLWVVSEEEAKNTITRRQYDVTIVDSSLVQDIPWLISYLREAQPEMHVVVVSLWPTWIGAREALLAGATDYIIYGSLDGKSLRAQIQAVLEAPLPVWQHKEELQTLKSISRASKIKTTILLVENDPYFRATRAEFLELNGYRVLLANSPAEAQKLLEQGGIDLAILDIRLTDDDDRHDTSGLNIAKTVTPSIPKIIMTGYPSTDAVRETLGPQPNGLSWTIDFLTKEEGPEAMVASVERSIQGSISVHVQLERDYEEARAQAIFTHRIRLILIIVGTIVILGGAVAVILSQTATGILGIVSGAIAQTLAALFTKLSDDANKRMDRYHKELLKIYREQK